MVFLPPVELKSVHIAILYRAAKFKSTNIMLVMVIWDSPTKFSSHQYFRICGILSTAYSMISHTPSFWRVWLLWYCGTSHNGLSKIQTLHTTDVRLVVIPSVFVPSKVQTFASVWAIQVQLISQSLLVFVYVKFRSIQPEPLYSAIYIDHNQLPCWPPQHRLSWDLPVCVQHGLDTWTTAFFESLNKLCNGAQCSN